MAGKSVNDVQEFQPILNVVALEKSNFGNDVKPEHSLQASLKSCPLDVSIKGNEVNELHCLQVCENDVQADVLITGIAAKLEQSRQARYKLVTLSNTSGREINVVMLVAPYHAAVKSWEPDAL